MFDIDLNHLLTHTDEHKALDYCYRCKYWAWQLVLLFSDTVASGQTNFLFI